MQICDMVEWDKVWAPDVLQEMRAGGELLDLDLRSRSEGGDWVSCHAHSLIMALVSPVLRRMIAWESAKASATPGVLTLELEEVCEYLTCICATTEVSREDSSAELVVAYLDLTNGTASERLRIPTRPLAPLVAAATQPWLQLDEPGALDVRARSERLVVAMRTRGAPPSDDPVVRLVQLDLAALLP